VHRCGRWPLPGAVALDLGEREVAVAAQLARDGSQSVLGLAIRSSSAQRRIVSNSSCAWYKARRLNLALREWTHYEQHGHRALVELDARRPSGESPQPADRRRVPPLQGDSERRRLSLGAGCDHPHRHAVTSASRPGKARAARPRTRSHPGQRSTEPDQRHLAGVSSSGGDRERIGERERLAFLNDGWTRSGTSLAATLPPG